jgi:uncharacterized protein DUF4185
MAHTQAVSKLLLFLLLAECVGLLASADRASAAAPYPQSEYMTGIAWDKSTHRTCCSDSDLWAVTWGPDDRVYTAWGDGAKPGCAGKVSYGVAAIAGGPSANLSNVSCGPGGTGKGKFSSIIFVDGVLYAVVNLQNTAWPYPNHTIWWSTNGGDSWQKPSWIFSGSSGSLTPSVFVNVGKNHAGAPDGYVYVTAEKRMNDADRNDVYLMRVHKSGLKDKRQYQYFAGMSGQTPLWDANASAAQPMFTDPAQGVRIPVMMYNPSRHRYLLTVAHGHGGQIGLFESQHPWGPWKTVMYENHWLGIASGSTHLGLSFPIKWMADGGKTLWAVFSCYGRGCPAYHDKYNLMRATLTTSGGTANPSPMAPRPAP